MHNKSLRYTYFLVLLFLFTGCATTRLAPETVKGFKKVGVVSLTAHDFHRRYTGLTFFGNEVEKRDISLWKVDDEYERQMRDTLSKLGIFETVVVPFERKDFAPAYDAPDFNKVVDQVKALAKKHSLDAVVMVIPHEGGELGVEGAGFWARGGGNATLFSFIHLVSSIGVIDGKTGNLLATKGFVFTKAVEPELSRATILSLSDSRSAEIRDMLIALPKDGWESKFRNIFLGEAN